MNCKEYKLVASDYIDRILEEGLAVSYEAHLAVCQDCSIHLDQTRRVSLTLKHSERPSTPREMHGNVMNAARRIAAGQITVGQRVSEWLSRLNPLLISYSTGVVASALLFMGTLAGFRPIPYIDQDAEITPLTAAGDDGSFGGGVIEVILGTPTEYNAYNGVRLLASNSGEQGYELPRFRENGPMTSLALTAWPKTGDESAALLVEIGRDGRARIIDVLSMPKNRSLIWEMGWTLSMRPFEPAKKTDSGQPITTRIVLLNYKVDVTG
ncbi:MAG TPA: zf-HC2 domain-containing protein [Blastocatellia bacterium]|nr:zf-HC2 domain-containing protein [Blastocatellia bacterium]